ncbi:MAG: hypothetical protein MRY21_06640 [Simkaniaceae bacterium]|nr:hypothetical protein [Simkaniaceae bacterium]
MFAIVGAFATPTIPTAILDSYVLEQYSEKITQELEEQLSKQNDGRTLRCTREYGYSFFKLENGDRCYIPPPHFLQELGAHVCLALGEEPVVFTNIILSQYDEGFYLEPHVDVACDYRYKSSDFYFDEKVYGLVIDADTTGALYFVKWEGVGRPPLDLKPIYSLEEEAGVVFCLKDQLRHFPYFHGVSKVKNHRITLTFRTVSFEK